MTPPPSREPGQAEVTDAKPHTTIVKLDNFLRANDAMSEEGTAIVQELLADRARDQERIADVLGFLRSRPGWSSDVPEEQRLAWWRKAEDVCALLEVSDGE